MLPCVLKSMRIDEEDVKELSLKEQIEYWIPMIRRIARSVDGYCEV